MSREELLELAALDALSLLDEYEAALFTRSFHHAPTAVQEEIKALQAAFATDDTLLPDVQPSQALRERVLNAMARAIESESVKLAPLATIGRPPSERRAATVARIGLGGSGQFWRAATFVLVGVLVALVVIGSQRVQPNDKFQAFVVDLFAQEQVKAILEEEAREDIIGRDFMEFIQAPNPRVVTLGSKDHSAAALLLFDPTHEDALLLSVGLAAHTEYTLTATDGTTTITRTFQPLAAMHALTIDHVSPSLFAGLTWTVTEVATGAVVLERTA